MINSRYGKHYETKEVERYLDEIDLALKDRNPFSSEFNEALMFCEFVCRVLSNLKNEEKQLLIKTLKAQQDEEMEEYRKLDQIPF